MADELKVTQADHEAAHRFWACEGRGGHMPNEWVEAFARHRIATETRVQATIDELVGAIESASKLEQWIAERAAKIDHARYLESEGDTGKVNPEIDVLANAQFDGMLASYRDEFATILSRHKGEGK